DMKKNYQELSQTETRFIEGIGSDIKKSNVTELSYTRTPVASMGKLITLTEQVRANLAVIKVPALIFSSARDHVVPPENAQEIVESISSEKRIIETLENSYHVATLDHDKEQIAKKSLEFIRSLP